MYGIEPQSVETIVAKPYDCILNCKSAHLRLTEIDRVPPRRLRFHEEFRRVSAKVVSFRPEVIVDDVEQHHQAALVRGVHQRFEVFRPAIGAVGRVPEHAVIAPVAAACEIRYRHQFERRDACLYEMIELIDGGAKGACLRKRADMRFEDHCFVPRSPAPVRDTPRVGGVFDHLAQSKDILRLKRGCGVGDIDLVIDTKSVAGARGSVGDFGDVPTASLVHHRHVAIDHEVHSLGGGRPQPELYAVAGNEGTKLAFQHAGFGRLCWMVGQGPSRTGGCSSIGSLCN